MPTSHGGGSRARSGRTSDEFCFGTLDGQPVVFLPRHGRGHVLPPSEINFRANIDALKRCGVTDLVSLSAVGSLREDLAARRFRRRRPVYRPHFCPAQELLRRRLRRPCFDGASGLRPDRRRAGRGRGAGRIALKRGGTYLVMEGPQFSSLAESRALPIVELRRDRHDQHARGQTRPRGRDLLRYRGHGHRFRLLAPGSRRRDRRNDRRGYAGQCAKRPRRWSRSVVPLSATHAGPCRQGCRHALDQALVTAPERRDRCCWPVSTRSPRGCSVARIEAPMR